MDFVYTINEKNENSQFDDDDFIVYKTFEKAVQISKNLLKEEFKIIKENLDDCNDKLEASEYINVDKEIFEAEISNNEEVFYTVSVKKIRVS